MKNRMKQISAVALVVCMAVSLCACGLLKKDEEKETSSAEVDALQDALEESAVKSHSDENGKETTVYVLTDANGKVNSTIVSEWLKNGDGANTIIDKSTLKDIENTKDEADYTSNSDGTITWNTEGKDVYYRGTTNEKLPVSMNIKYELDNKEVTADELAGASGHLKMTFTYENHEEKDYIINGKPCKIYQPYMMVSGTIFDYDKASGIKVDKGKVIDTGDASIVMGMAMPGFSESLNLGELAEKADIHIPENVVIEADVTDFSMMATITFASNDLLSELGLNDVESVDDLQKSLNELDDAANKLVDGTGELEDGTSKLKDGSSKLAGGAQDLDDGVDDLADGVQLISDKMKKLQNGSKDLSAGMESLKDGAVALDNGLNQLDAKVSGLPEQAKALNEYLGSIQENAAMLAATLGSPVNGQSVSDPTREDISAAEEKVDDARGELQAFRDGLSEEQIEVLGDKIELLESVESKLDAAGGRLDDAANMTGTMVQTQSETGDSVKKIAGALAQILEKTGELEVSSKELAGGVSQLKSGADELASGAQAIASGANQINSGAGQLADGASTLNSGTKTLKKGTSKLADGAGDLDKGVSKLADGAKELKDGMQKFYSEGICELTDLMEKDLLGTYDRLKAVKSFQESQEAFGGCADGTDCTVKYIYKSSQIGETDE